MSTKFKFYLPEEYADVSSIRSNETLREKLNSGSWENEEIKIISEYLSPDDTVLELGACIGYLGVHVNAIIKNKKQHTVIEANPNLIHVIEKNKEINGSQFSIENCMIGNPDKIDGTFAISNFIMGSSIFSKSNNKVKVEVKPLTDYIGKYNTIIIDIEGGEYDLIDEYKDHLKNFDKIIIEMHPFFGFTIDDLNRTVNIIKRSGFKVIKRDGHIFYFTKI